MRKLASVQVVHNIEKINSADRIELAHVLGWQCVVNVGQFKVGDKAVYFEIDSFLPIKPEYEFLRNTSYKKTDIMGEGFRLKTRRIRDTLSQGLLMPLSVLGINEGTEVGADVTELLGVKKFEVEERATTGGTIIGQLPQEVPHTEETRVQSRPELIEEFKKQDYYITTKMDGTSCSVCVNDSGFHVTGHRFEYKDDGKSSFYNYINSKGIKKKLEDFVKEKCLRSITIQGEFCGPGIQKNRLKLSSPEWFVFNVIIDGERSNVLTLLEICGKIGLRNVPIEEVGTGYDFTKKYDTVESLLKRADGFYRKINSKGEEENIGKKRGIVIRPLFPVYCKAISAPLSMKVVSNRYPSD